MTDQFSGIDVIEVVENQLDDQAPKIVKETLMRLMMTGHSREDALELIACALTEELVAVAERQEAFNLTRYTQNLSGLPEMPWISEE
ncbi:hypothetical protein [Echinimonas agarilytica]|uniref:Uncharacterized protein n=1 Tax=Echinimonas agarilytica TaxID=1215918 RepID=A0AA41W959_9GAMM|nr:hypothetical protein [Echinimonas agarilytica]MCM2681394.1 hypothetical protein [Echinimonas agarilytica]